MLITLQQLKTSLSAVKSYVDKILPKKVSDLDNDTGFITNEEISGKVDIEDLASVATSGDYDDLINKPTIPVVPVTDVQINEMSILSDGVANIPKASLSTVGAVKVNGTFGTAMRDVPNDDTIMIAKANITNIKEGMNRYQPIVPYNQHEAVFYGLTKVAGVDMASSDNAVGTYTNEAKSAIRNMIGAVGATDYATQSTGGVVKIINNGSGGVQIDQGYLMLQPASSNSIKSSNSSTLGAIVPGSQHSSTFYGLAKAAGDTTQSQSDNEVGTYTDTAKTAIKTMLGVPNDSYDLSEGELLPANADISSYTTPGIYYADDSTASTISTSPTDLRFKLIVEKINDKEVRQTIVDYMGRNFTTVINTVSHGFTMWDRVATNDDLSYLVQDVQINGTSIVDEYGWANIPVASSSTAGVTRFSSTFGLYTDSNYPEFARIAAASLDDIKTADSSNVCTHKPIVPYRQHYSTFYGLAKAAGDTTQSSSSNAVGTYTTNAKMSIQNMLGISDTFVTRDSVNDAGISARTYTNLFNGEFSVTTAADAEWLNPHARASVTGRISKHYVYRVTVNGTVYNLPCRLWWEPQNANIKVYEYIGNIGLYIGDTSGVPGKKDNVNFVIISDLNNSESIDVLTTTAGSYTILVERVNETLKPLPRSLIYYDEYQPFEVNNNGGTYNGFSLGVNTLSNQRGTTAIGYGNIISNQFAIAIGSKNSISGNNGVAIGYDHNISGSMGVAFGSSNTVSGSSGVAFGDSTTANCNNMVAMGRHNVGANTTFPNWQNNTDYKKGDIVKGKWNTMTFTWLCILSHKSVASGSFMDDVSSSNNEMQWKLAPSDGDTAFVVGNGSTKQDRSNAFKIDFAGNGFFGADVYVNCNADSTGGQKLATEDYVNSVAVISDVQIDGTSILNNGVANIPKASTSSLGLITTTSSQGLNINHNSGTIYINDATSAQIKSADSEHKPVTTQRQHESVFYGLAKAAGDITQSSSSNAVGTYTDNAKAAIRAMIGASDEIFIGSTTPSGYTLYIDTEGMIEDSEEVSY